MTGCCKGSRFI